mmetsp:Transcript_11551/g.12484  ORF Transcript_11551/g.12484 Transcript_11551/m.12484 type:complete len:236 (+) Transcript_11551:239-946(+)
MTSVLALTCPIEAKASVLNDLEHIDSLGDMDLESRVRTVLESICAVGLSKILAVDRQHKHFNMPADGILPVYTKTLNPDIVEFSIVPSTIPPDCFPFSFGFWNGEFVVTSVFEPNSVPALLKENLATLIGKPDALESVLRVISEMGMEKYIGLSFRLDEALGVADGVHHLNEKTFSNCSQLLQVCQGASPDKSENSIITSWTSDSDETQRPFMRGCWRYCEWGPIKGHVTYHKTD